MVIKIYVDILFLTNLIFDFILLLFTAIFTKNLVKPFRLLLASCIGGIISVISFFYIKNTAQVMLIGLLTSSAMVISAFGIKDFFGCVRLSAVLYVCTFTLGGAIFSLIKSDGFISSGGAFYIDVGMTELLFSGTATYILSNISYGYLLNKKTVRQSITYVTVENNNERLELQGFYDTGNSVKDTNGRGVIIAEKEAVKALLDRKDISFENVRIKTVGGETVLKMFTPEKICIYSSGREIEKKNKIAVSEKAFCGNHSLILPNDFFD